MSANGIYGLSCSGLDIESMVKVGMMSKQNQYDKMQQTYTKNEWKKEAYLEVYDKLQTYNTSTLSTFKMSSSMNAREATSSDSRIKVTANSSAPAMNHTITVNQTATNAYLNGSTALTRGSSGTSGSTALKDSLFSKYAITENDGKYTATFYSWETVATTDATTGEVTYTYKTAAEFTNADTDDLKAAVAMSFNIGDGSSTGITSAAKYATANVSSSLFSDTDALKSTLYSAIATTLGFDSVSSISVSGNNVNITGSATISNVTSEITTTKATTDPAFSFTVDDGTKSETVSITYGDLAKVLSDENSTFQDFVKLLNEKFADASVNITASYDSDSNSLSFSNTVAGEDDTVSVQLIGGSGIGTSLVTAFSGATPGDSGTFTVGTHLTLANNEKGTGHAAEVNTENMKTVSFTYLDMVNGLSYYDFVSKVNNQGLNVRATYDAAQDTFAIYNMKTGESNNIAINISSTAQDGKNAAYFLNGMGLKKTANGTADESSLKFSTGTTVMQSGTNASVLVDGLEYKDIDSNNLTVKGVTYNFANVTEKTTATVTVEQDVDKIVDNVKSFVESYNTLLDDLYKMYRETPNSSYKPLTDAQKNEMTEEQIKKWEEKAKSGMLYHDNTLRKIIDNMRSAITNSIQYENGTSYKYDSAYSIGISTTGLYGQIKLDEDKLRTALSDDPDSVYKVFAKLDTTKEDSKDQANGIAQRLGGVMTDAVKSIANVAGTNSDTSDDSTLSVLLRNLQTRMSNFQSMMNAFETSLYKKYDAMEATLASLGTQLNYVTSAFSS